MDTLIITVFRLVLLELLKYIVVIKVNSYNYVMKIQEIIKEFDLSEGTVHNWKKSKKGRKILYEVLKAIPNEFVEGVKKKLEEEEKLKNSLKG